MAGGAAAEGDRGAELVIEHLEVQIVGAAESAAVTGRAGGTRRAGQAEAAEAGPVAGAWDPAVRNYIGRW
jgi:hypothetical protein